MTPSAPTVSSRDFSLDFLRALAILEVVLAHSHLPEWLFQVRNFGVPLLMLLSGWSIDIAIRHKRVGFFEYLGRRFRRLIIPCWIFLSVFFSLFYISDAIGVTDQDYGWRTIAGSFLFAGGIPYMWVIRVNLMIAVITPLLLIWNQKVKNDLIFIVACATAIAGSTAAWMLFDTPFFHYHLGKAHYVVNISVFYLATYGAIFALGMRIHSFSQRTLLVMAGVSMVVYAVICSALFMQTGDFVPTQRFKYPPQLYYVSYALAVSLTLISIRQPLANMLPQGKLSNAISFIGSNTLWIYLWHIFTVKLVRKITGEGLWPDNFMATWIGIAALAIFIFWAQGKLISYGMRYIPSRWHVFASMFTSDRPPARAVSKD